MTGLIGGESCLILRATRMTGEASDSRLFIRNNYGLAWRELK